jgi:Spy/CpxP family protein refolding chaperone
MDSYAERLKLTDEQEASIRVILETQAEKGREMFEAARAQSREAMDEIRPKMAQLQAETSRQIEALLTENQIPEYHKIQAELQERRRSMRRRQPGS